MALTGVYRQALQQIFSIQILDELFQGNVTGLGSDNSDENNFPVIHEFEDAKPNVSVQNATAQTINVQNSQNITVNSNEIIPEQAEITEDYIENEFAEYFSGGEVA